MTPSIEWLSANTLASKNKINGTYYKLLLLNKDMNYKDYILSRGGKELGIAWADIKEYLLTPQELRKFEYFMRGQTMSTVGGMTIVYTEDFERFIRLNNK